MSRRRLDDILVIAIVAVGWALWLQRMGVNDHDDAVSNELIFAANPAATIVLRNPWPDQSPLYFLFLHGLRPFGQSPFAMQFVNACVATLILTSLYALGLSVSGSPLVALGAVALGAVSPASLWLVRNGRMYTIQTLLSVLAMLALARFLERRRPRDLFALAMACILNIYTHYLGFLITSIVFVPLVVEAVRERPRADTEPGGPDETVRSWRLARQVSIAGVAIGIATFPQMLRLAALARSGAPVQSAMSLPGFSSAFLDQIVNFWFVNAAWGSLARAGSVVPAIYFGSAAALIVVGVSLARREVRVLTVAGIVLPVIVLGVAAYRMDVRARYFAWALPLLWLVISMGAFGTRSSTRSGAAVEAERGVRAALLVAVIGISLWLVWNKVPERYAQWTKLMTGLQQVYRPSMVVYMPAGPADGTPKFLASHLGLPPGLGDIRPLGADTRGPFLEQAAQGREFVFLVHRPYENGEMAWREEYLRAHGYRRGVLPVWGARADLFTRAAVDGFSREARLPDHPSPADIVPWIRRRVQQTSTTITDHPTLRDAVVARIHPDGRVQESRVFISQHGEDGSWRLSDNEWDGVDETQLSSGGIDRHAIASRPVADTVLAIAFPPMKLRESLVVTYGLVDPRLRFAAPADVRLAVFVNGVGAGDAMGLGPGWHELVADTSALEGTTGDVVLLLESNRGNDGPDLAFQFATEQRPAPRFSATAPTAEHGPVDLTGGRTLKDALDRLTVFRLSGETRIEPHHAVGVHSAADMHEESDSSGRGAVRTEWILGAAAWDIVGLTKQQSGGAARDGVWAHPRNGTTLVLEAPSATTGRVLRGYLGVTDFAVARAAAQKTSAPIRLRIFVGDNLVVDRLASRSPGWQTFESPLEGGPGSRRLEITIDCAMDSWAHFVFDLWSE